MPVELESRGAEPAARAMRLAAAAVVVLTLSVFLPVLQNGFVNWDDPNNLLTNYRFRGFGPDALAWMFSAFHLGHYHPLTWLSFALDHQLWDLRPAGVHFTSLALHAANAGLLSFVAWTLAQRMGGRGGGLAAACAVAALAWALHPLRVEAVAWATARRDVLSAFFALLTLIFYLKAVDRDPRDRRMWAAAVAFFLAALLSKASVLPLPLALVACDLHPLRRLRGHPPTRRARALLLEKWPFLAPAALLGAVALAASHASGAMSTSAAQHGLLGRIVQAGYGLALYAAKAIDPRDLWPAYLFEPAALTSEARFLVPSVLAWAMLGAAALAARRLPGLAVTAFSTFVLAMPVLGFAQSGPQVAADRYTYLAAMPLAAALAWALGVPLARARPAVRSAVVALAIGALAALAVQTRAQLGVWRDSLTLWNHVLARDPDNSVALVNRGVARQEEGNLAGAGADFDRVLEMNHASLNGLLNRGSLRAERGDAAGARADFEAALAVDSASAVALNNRGALRWADGDLAGAAADFDAAIARQPDYADAWYNRASLRAETGDATGALADFAMSLRLDPANARAWHNRGVLRQKMGDRAGAIDDYRRALLLEPSRAEEYRRTRLYEVLEPPAPNRRGLN